MEVNVYCFLTISAYFLVPENLYTLFIYIYMRDILLINSPNRVILLILSTLQPKVCLPKNSPFGYFLLTLQLEMTKR